MNKEKEVKNQYAGDINDYGKYIILKALNDAGLSIAVCWMLTPDDGRGDGKRISYLDIDEYHSYAPQIYDTLKEIVRSGHRELSAIQAASMFPGAQYFNQLTEIDVNRDTDLVFLDPDNGFEVASTPKGKTGSERYVSWDTVADLYYGGWSLMVYQHFPRVNREHFINSLSGKIKRAIGSDSVTHIYTGNVDFVILSQINHQRKIETAINEIRVKVGGFFGITHEESPE